MRFGQADIPEDLSYTKTHLWVRVQDDLCTLGWTDYIQSNAGDVNFIELPEKGALLAIDQDFGSIETSKWVDRLYSPISERVANVNSEVIHTPELINLDPFGEGWFIQVGLQGIMNRQHLISAVEYFEYIKASEELEYGIT